MNHEYRSVDKWANIRGFDSNYPNTAVVAQDGCLFSILKNTKNKIKITAILGNRGLSSATVKGLKKELKAYGKMRYNKKPSYIEFIYKLKNSDDASGIDQALGILTSTFQHYHIQTTSDCVYCGLGDSDGGVERIAGRVYPAHKACIIAREQGGKKRKQKPKQKPKQKQEKTSKKAAQAQAQEKAYQRLAKEGSQAQEKAYQRLTTEGPQAQEITAPSGQGVIVSSPNTPMTTPKTPKKKSYLLGLIGGLIGGLIFSLPFILAFGFFAKFWVWLLVLIPLGVALGYYILRGKRGRGGQALAVILSLLLVALATGVASYQAPYHFNYQSFKQAKEIIDGEATLEEVASENLYIQDYMNAYGTIFTNLETQGAPKYSEHKNAFTPSQFWEQGFIAELLSISSLKKRIEDVSLIALFTILGLSLALPPIGKGRKTKAELWEEDLEGYVPSNIPADPGLAPKRQEPIGAPIPVSPADYPPPHQTAPDSRVPPAPSPSATSEPAAYIPSTEEPIMVLDRTPVSGEHLFENQPEPDFEQKTKAVSKTYEELFADILDD